MSFLVGFLSRRKKVKPFEGFRIAGLSYIIIYLISLDQEDSSACNNNYNNMYVRSFLSVCLSDFPLSGCPLSVWIEYFNNSRFPLIQHESLYSRTTE
jgi:hypothetical protein